MWLYMGRGEALSAFGRYRRIRTLEECTDACGMAFRRCLERVQEAPDREWYDPLTRALAAAKDCLELCSLTASLMTRESELARLATRLCAEACLICAEACDALSTDDAAAECSRRCRHCEEVCRSFVA